MKLAKANVRGMFQNHTIVFGVEETLFYAKADKKKEKVAARIAAMANDSLRIFVPMGRNQTLKVFANINLLKGGIAGIRKAMEAEQNGRVTDTAVNVIYSKLQKDQYHVALELLRTHWNHGVSSHKWEYLTAAAKNEFHYTGTKKPHVEETEPAAKLSQKIVKDMMRAADKPARKPRVKKVTEGQALLAHAGVVFDGNGKMHTAKAMPPAAEPVRARKPRTSPAKAPSSAKASKAVPEQGKWSADDDAYFVSVMDSAAAMTRRLQEIEDARRKGISVAEYDKKAEAARARKQRAANPKK